MQWLEAAQRISWCVLCLVILARTHFGVSLIPPAAEPLVGFWFGGAILLALVLFIARPLVRLRGNRTVQRFAFQLCPGCRYHLAHLPDPGVCPECGRAFSREELKRAWVTAYAKEHWLYG
jgi:ssDNA-binding Zn-finger/Zn-ribbon topoisomerase 1